MGPSDSGYLGWVGAVAEKIPRNGTQSGPPENPGYSDWPAAGLYEVGNVHLARRPLQCLQPSPRPSIRFKAIC